MHSPEFKEAETKSISQRMDEIVSSMPESGPLPETDRMINELKSVFPAELIPKLDVFLSRKKLEIALPIFWKLEERRIFLRYRKGEGATIRVTNGVREGEMTLYEEKMPEKAEEVTERIPRLIEETILNLKKERLSLF